MYQEHKFTFTHQELVSYVKRYLASCGITEYDCWEKSYDTEDWYGIKTHWDTCRIFGLPAPYNIGHIQIDIVNTHISFRLIAKQERKLDEDEQKLYKTDIIKTADDIWVFEMADAEKDERYSDRRTGFNYGYEIHEHNIQQFNDFLNTIFREKYNTMFVVQLAAECYEKQRMIKEFEELAANAWHLHKKLWDTINDFSTQWGETDRMKLINRYNLSLKQKMKQKDNHKILCNSAKKIQDVLVKNNFEIVEGPNIGNCMCYWLVESGKPYYEGVYISKKYYHGKKFNESE